MRSDTIALHGHDPWADENGAVTVPIRQTVCASADDAAALSNLEHINFRCGLLKILAITVLERPVVLSENVLASSYVTTGHTIQTYKVSNAAKADPGILALLLWYCGSYTLLSHFLPKFVINVRLAESQLSNTVRSVNLDTRAAFSASTGNLAVKIRDIETLATTVYHDQVLSIVDNTVPTLVLSQPAGPSSDVVVHSPLEFADGRDTLLGNSKSLACYPASLAYPQMPVQAPVKAGVGSELSHLSMRIKHEEDITNDAQSGVGALLTC